MSAGGRTLHVEYFASLREHRGVARETVVSRAANAAELYDELSSRYGFRVPREKTRVALNNVVSPWDTQLQEGDTVVFLTPFGGG